MHVTCSTNVNNHFYCDHCMLSVKKTADTAELVLPDEIRRSHLELYRSCPYSFFLEVIKGLGNVETIYTRLGQDVHTIIEKHEMNRATSLENLKELFRDLYRLYTNDLFGDVDKDKMYERGMTCIETYHNVVAPTLPESYFALEKKIVHKIAEDLPAISITMDRIDEVDGMLEVHDWKTGKVMVGKKLSVDLQAPLYIWMIEKEFGMKVRKFTFHYLNENKYRVFERRNDDEFVCTVNKREYVVSLTETIREVKQILSRIKNGEFNIPRDVKKLYFTCKTCSQFANGACRGAEVESWHMVN